MDPVLEWNTYGTNDWGESSSQGPSRQPEVASYRSHDDRGYQPECRPKPSRQLRSLSQPRMATDLPREMQLMPKRRSRRQQLDWYQYKDTIKRLYLDDDKSLAETMKILKEDFSFEAP